MRGVYCFASTLLRECSLEKHMPRIKGDLVPSSVKEEVSLLITELDRDLCTFSNTNAFARTSYDGSAPSTRVHGPTCPILNSSLLNRDGNTSYTQFKFFSEDTPCIVCLSSLYVLKTALSDVSLLVEELSSFVRSTAINAALMARLLVKVFAVEYQSPRASVNQLVREFCRQVSTRLLSAVQLPVVTANPQQVYAFYPFALFAAKNVSLTRAVQLLTSRKASSEKVCVAILPAKVAKLLPDAVLLSGVDLTKLPDLTPTIQAFLQDGMSLEDAALTASSL